MATTTALTRKPSCVHRHSYYMKMVYCYFLATTASSMRRMAAGSRGSSGILVEAFLVPKRTIHCDTRKTFGSSATALFSTATETNTKIKIPRPEKLSVDNPPPLLNLHTIALDELQELVVSWGYPKFRGKQIYGWIRDKGVTNPNDMANLPKALRETITEFTARSDGDASGGALQLAFEAISKDGTRKRAYELRDGQLIESVLMGPYEDGRYTACISSQAGCAMGCVFCATGQMGFARQLSSDEIFEQVSRFASELKREQDPSKRLSNIVFMGMGEPLANYRNVVDAVNRINSELGIGARKITVSTVGVVPSIKKLFTENTEMPQVRLAVSLHCADDDERTKLLPANARYGGLSELMTTLKDYIDTTGRRITLEWALIAHQNDGLDTARQLGNLVRKHKLRNDMVHVNVIPLNPTDGFEGAKPSNPKRVKAFCDCLQNEFSITATPRVRRGIDIDAGCGQLKAKVQKREDQKKRKEQEAQLQQETELSTFIPELQSAPIIGVYDDDEEDENDVEPTPTEAILQQQQQQRVVEFTLADNAVDFEFDEFEDPEYEVDSQDMVEALRLVSLVEQGAFATPAAAPPTSQTTIDDSDKAVKGPTTSIVDEDAVRKAKKKRKKLLRNLKQIKQLKEKHSSGEISSLSREQLDKIAKEEQWRNEVEDLEHNLKA